MDYFNILKMLEESYDTHEKNWALSIFSYNF